MSSDILQSRLQESLEIYKSGLAPRIYTIGSGAPGDRTTEAAASKTWLINNGVKKSNILSITKGRDTLSSTQAYAAAMKKAKHTSVIIVTDPYHCYRAMTEARDQGIAASCAQAQSGPGSLKATGLRYIFRETAAYLAYETVGRFGIHLSDQIKK